MTTLINPKFQSLSVKLLTVLLSGVLLLSQMAVAQDCEPWYPMEEGTSFEMTSYNAKDKLQSTTRHKIIEKKGSGNMIESIVKMESMDKKGNSTFSTEYSLICDNGNFKVDMRNMMSQESMGGMLPTFTRRG